MPNRANLSVPAVFAGSLATAVMLSPNWAVSATGECFRKPNLEANRGAGHWYYYADRVNHRRCWFFEASGETVSPPSSPDPVVTENADPEPSWFSRFAAGVAEALHPQPQQTMPLQYAPEQSGALDNSIPVTRTAATVTRTAASPKHPRHPRTNQITRREQPQTVSHPVTNGAASAQRYDQLPPQRIAEKNEKHAPELTAAKRQELFEDFLKWYTNRNIFGRP
jgi:hypothetical protein